MSRQRYRLVTYRHQVLMNRVNEFFIDLKKHLYLGHAAPDRAEMDRLMYEILDALREDWEPMRK